MKRNRFIIALCVGFFVLLLITVTSCVSRASAVNGFVPMWADSWTPPKSLLDFAEKAALTQSGGGRLLSMAHRGDQINYPENSLEGVLSCIAMGVDVVELDVRITKDDVLILSHDGDLARCTSVKQARLLNPEAFPESNLIRDWTYEELSELYLLDKYNKPGEYRIPKLEDIVKACAGRMVILLDKMELAAEDAGMPEAVLKGRFLDPILEKYDSVPSCVMGWHFNRENMVSLGEYAPFRREEIAAKRGAEYRGKCVEAQTLNWQLDKKEVWADMREAGVDLIMTNNPMGLARYIAETIK